jgi:predicted RNase H-like HicB family nuclease
LVRYSIILSKGKFKKTEVQGATMTYKFTAVITREGKFFVSDCPELGITSQGLTLEEALDNLKEAIHLYLKDEDIKNLNLTALSPLVTTVEVAV